MQGEKRNLLPPELEQQIKIYSDTHNVDYRELYNATVFVIDTFSEIFAEQFISHPQFALFLQGLSAFQHIVNSSEDC